MRRSTKLGLAGMLNVVGVVACGIMAVFTGNPLWFVGSALFIPPGWKLVNRADELADKEMGV